MPVFTTIFSFATAIGIVALTLSDVPKRYPALASARSALWAAAFAAASQGTFAVLHEVDYLSSSLVRAAAYMLSGTALTLTFLLVGLYLRNTTPEMYLEGWRRYGRPVTPETAESTVKLIRVVGLLLIVLGFFAMPVALWLALN